MSPSPFPSAKALPALNIPDSSHTVKVSVIDSGVRLRATRISKLLSPSIKGHDVFTGPSYSFLIENASSASNGAPAKSRKILFDLNMRKDWRSLAPLVVQSIDAGGFEIEVEKNVSDVLSDGGEDLRDIEAIVWRLV